MVTGLTVLTATTLVVMMCAASPAFANGIDLPSRRARQGDTITVTGHAWLTCCPANTPVEHVRLFLVRGPGLEEAERMLLFDVAANEEGVISTAFTVPNVTPGRYRLEACGGIQPETAPCLPEGRFTVLAGLPRSPASPPGSSGDGPGWWLPALLVLMLGGAIIVAASKHRDPSDVTVTTQGAGD